MREETIKRLIKELDRTDEMFFISKSNGDEYTLIHSELTDLDEWIDMVDHFSTKLKEKRALISKNDDAANDLLSSHDINLN